MKNYNLYSLKVYPNGRGRDVYRKIEIMGDRTLDSLCIVIIESFDFIHEHLYEFCMDNRMYSDNSYSVEPEYGERSTDISLDKLKLQKGQKFLLHYDFGDDWLFTIRVEDIVKTKEDVVSHVTKSKGSIEQYPDFDGWEDEEDEIE